ncbi:hypothetical protein IWQ57_001855, partial [Coemansia nantahalensis]
HFDAIAGQVRSQYRRLSRCATQRALDRTWGDVLILRQTLQDHCEEFIFTHPAAADAVAADRYLWRAVYYDAIAECRKRLRLRPRLCPALLNLSRAGSIASSSDGVGSNEGGSAGTSAEGQLEEWMREWWSRTLVALFNEALGYLQDLLRRVLESLGPAPLSHALRHALRHADDPLHPPPPGFPVARRLYVYIGDLYRYQCMHLPLVSSGAAVPVDTSVLLDLARSSYARARAMHAGSACACTQLALLAAHAHDRFEAVFWQLCGLCYAGRPAGPRALLHSWPPDDEACEDHIEASVIALVLAMIGSPGGAAPEEAFRDALDALEDDLEGTRAQSTPPSLADDFWAREYQLGVVLAALLTVVTHVLPASDAVRQEYRDYIQRLAVTLLLRQVLCLHRMLDHRPAQSTIYPLASAALWADIWRSSAPLSDACADWHAQDLVPRAAELFGELVRLIREHSDIELSQTAELRDQACTALPHDVALVGWVSLQAVQQELRYEDVGDPFADPTTDNSPSLLGLWQKPRTTLQVALARIQALLLAEVGALPFLSWGTSGELVVAAPTPMPSPAPSSVTDPAVDSAVGLDDMSSGVSPLPPSPRLPEADAQLLPLFVPDEETWRHHLPALQKWLIAGSAQVVLAAAVQNRLESSGADDHKAQAALRFAASAAGSVWQTDACLEHWRDAEEHFRDVAELVESGMVDEDEELPPAADVPDEMRGVLSCALHLSRVRIPACDVTLVTDSEELAFYASWFALPCVQASQLADAHHRQ